MSLPTSRRRFLAQTAVAAAGLGAAGRAHAVTTQEATAVPIVDTHQHLWELDRFNLPWLEGAPKIRRTFNMEHYQRATRGLHVVKTVYMEVDVDPSQQVAEAEYVFDLCERSDNPMAAAVISGRPGLPGFGEYLDRFRGIRYLKGVRQVLHGPSTPAGYCLQPEFVRSMRLLGDRGLSFDLCMRSTDIGDAVRLVDQCPNTRFILDHCGNMSPQAKDRSQWAEDISHLAERKNVICKVSGIIASADPDHWKPQDLEPIIRHVIREFGTDRVIFGGDWPVCTLTATFRQWVDALNWIVRDMKPADRRRLFHDNAVAFYGLA